MPLPDSRAQLSVYHYPIFLLSPCSQSPRNSPRHLSKQLCSRVPIRLLLAWVYSCFSQQRTLCSLSSHIPRTGRELTGVGVWEWVPHGLYHPGTQSLSWGPFSSPGVSHGSGLGYDDVCGGTLQTSVGHSRKQYSAIRASFALPPAGLSPVVKGKDPGVRLSGSNPDFIVPQLWDPCSVPQFPLLYNGDTIWVVVA
jgi:hypothetical protein